MMIMATSMSVADAQKAPGSGPNPFADCGIGAALFPTVGWAAAISNVIWDIGTTAVTSATASPETCNGKKAETAQFIIDNFDNLAEETAQGQGEHLTAMLDILGCKAETHSAIVSGIRSDMATVVNGEGYSDQHVLGKASGYYNVVNSAVEGQYTDSCSA